MFDAMGHTGTFRTATTGRRDSGRLAALLLGQTLVIAAGLTVVLLPVQSRLTWLTTQRVESENLAESYRLKSDLQNVSRDIDPSEPAWKDAIKTVLTTASFPAHARVVVLGSDGVVVGGTGQAHHADARLQDNVITVEGGQERVGDIGQDSTLVGLNNSGEWSFVHRLPNGAIMTVQQDADAMTAHVQASGRMMVAWAAGVMTILAGLGGFIVHRFIRKQHRGLEVRNNDLAVTLDKRLAQGLAARTALILGLAKLADYRDTDTGSHLERICAYSETLAKALRSSHGEINETWIAHIRPAASLHDIGKVGVPDSVLLKRGALSPNERKLVERHTYMGADTLIAIRQELGDDELINLAIQIALCHHERWDGTGYPLGLAGQQIPLAARIVALADVYDALTSRRVYKMALTHERACELITDLRGKHFDPDVVDAFAKVAHEFDLIRNKMQPFGDLVDAAHAKAA